MAGIDSQNLTQNNYLSGNAGDSFVGYDSNNNPMFKHYNFSGDAKYTARSEELANLSNWNMMLYQNEYNDPKNQISRLQEAGMNPLYYLGQNAGTTAAASGGNAQGHQMTSASGKTGQIIDASKNTADTLLQTQRQAQEYDIATRQMDLESKRIDIEQGKLDLERQGGSEVDQALKKSQTASNNKSVELAQSQIERLGKENEWTDQQIAESKSQIAVLEKQVDTLQATVNELNTRAGLNKAQEAKVYEEAAVIADTRWSQVEKTAAEADLTRQEYFSEVKKTTNWMLDNQLKEVNIKTGNQQFVNLRREGDRIEFELSQDKKYNDWERKIKMASTIIGSGASAVTAGAVIKFGSGVSKAVNNSNASLKQYNMSYGVGSYSYYPYNTPTNTYQNP